MIIAIKILQINANFVGKVNIIIIMQSKVEKFIEDEKLLKKNSKVVLGVSGGADSIALLNVLHNAGYKVIVAHCNFHLREDESVRDETFVKNLCKEYGLIYNAIDFDTIKHAAQYSMSIEMAARDLRYRWFEELRQQYDAEAIAVAHHRDDSVETAIMNMIRGTGIKGLTGIKAHVGYIIRPFLCVSRAEIEEYMQVTKLGHVEDSTNSESIYTRNIVRLDIMPYMERINPSAKQSIFKTMSFLKQAENIYNSYIADTKKKVMSDGKIDIAKLKKVVEPEAVLFEILSEYGFNSATANDIFNSLDSQSGKTFHSDLHILVKDRDFLLIEPKEEKKN